MLIDAEPCGLFTDEETDRDKFIISPANGTENKPSRRNLRVIANTSELLSSNSTRKTRHQRSARNGDDVFTDTATPAKCRERHGFLTLDFLRQRRTRRRTGFQPMTCYTSEVQGAALISDAGFSTPKKNKAQKWISTDDLLHQRSAGGGTDFCRWIFYAKEEQGAEMDFNR